MLHEFRHFEMHAILASQGASTSIFDKINNYVKGFFLLYLHNKNYMYYWRLKVLIYFE